MTDPMPRLLKLAVSIFFVSFSLSVSAARPQLPPAWDGSPARFDSRTYAYMPPVRIVAQDEPDLISGGDLLLESGNGQSDLQNARICVLRSREISACLVLQTKSQLKAIYKDNADTIIGNMDSQIFLGGSEPGTLKDLSEMLGKETIDSFNTSDTRGNSPSYGTTFQKMGHELLSRDELAVLDGGKCILQLRGVRPFLSDKYDLTQHPNYKLTSDYDPKNTFDIEKYLNRKTKIHPGDEFIVVDADSLPSA